MGELKIKEVDFNGATLMATQMEDEKIFVGVNWVCEGIGFDRNGKDTQVKKIQRDIVLKEGCVKFDVGVFDENNETLAIELNFLPLWLAKISITPKMQKENPFVAKNLVEYQLKAKDVLAKAFVEDNGLSKELQFLEGLLNKMKYAELNQKKIEEEQERQQSKILKLESDFDKESNVEGYVTNGNIARKLNLFSSTNKPHEMFVDAVAFEIGIYNNKIGYKDEYIKVVQEATRGIVTGVAYYTPLGVEVIKEYVENKFKPIEQKYVRGAKKGMFNKSSFTIRKSNFFFNESTQNKYGEDC